MNIKAPLKYSQYLEILTESKAEELTFRVCNRCKRLKPLISFMNRYNSDRLYRSCLLCRTANKTLRRTAKAMGEKYCPVCRQIKLIDQFWNDKTKPDGKVYACSECIKQVRKSRSLKDYCEQVVG